MRIRRTRGGVGEWNFTDETKLLGRADREAFVTLARLCQRVATVLEARDLLRAKLVVLFGWVSGPGEDPSLPVENAAQIGDEVSAFLARTDGEQTPAALHVIGDGAILDKDGSRRVVSDLIWLNASILDTPMITVCTQSDVWMPHDLRGLSHVEVYERNRGRLSGALQAIADLGLSPSEQTSTDFALQSGFELIGHQDEAGHAADVIVDESGVLSDEL